MTVVKENSIDAQTCPACGLAFAPEETLCRACGSARYPREKRSAAPSAWLLSGLKTAAYVLATFGLTCFILGGAGIVDPARLDQLIHLNEVEPGQYIIALAFFSSVLAALAAYAYSQLKKKTQ